eukprot:g46064.t1
MEDSEISMEHANMPGHFEIKKEVLLGLLKSIKVDKSPGPDDIYPMLLRKAREEIAVAVTKIFVSSLATRGLGSTLGPSLFVIDINDLDENVDGLI